MLRSRRVPDEACPVRRATVRVLPSCEEAFGGAVARPLHPPRAAGLRLSHRNRCRESRAQSLWPLLRQGPPPRFLGGNTWKSLTTESLSRRRAASGKPPGPKCLLACSNHSQALLGRSHCTNCGWSRVIRVGAAQLVRSEGRMSDGASGATRQCARRTHMRRPIIDCGHPACPCLLGASIPACVRPVGPGCPPSVPRLPLVLSLVAVGPSRSVHLTHPASGVPGPRPAFRARAPPRCKLAVFS